LLHKISAALVRETLLCSDEWRNNHTMVLVPAWSWWRGVVYRAVCVGVPVGIVNEIVMARRMDRFWPAARDLSAGDRVAAVRAARRA
jgi:hypothetical protein